VPPLGTNEGLAVRLIVKGKDRGCLSSANGKICPNQRILFPEATTFGSPTALTTQSFKRLLPRKDTIQKKFFWKKSA